MVRISVDVSDQVAEELTRLAQHCGSTPEAMLARWVADAVSERDELVAGWSEDARNWKPARLLTMRRLWQSWKPGPPRSRPAIVRSSEIALVE